MNKNEELLKKKKDQRLFGLSLYGDGATVKRMPLTNILASGAYIHTAVLEINDASEHLAKGGIKDAKYISSLFEPHIEHFENIEPHSVDYCTFDGAANVQKAAAVLNAIYPRTVYTHGAEHVISLFFQDCFKSQLLNLFVKIQGKPMPCLEVAPCILLMPSSKNTVKFTTRVKILGLLEHRKHEWEERPLHYIDCYV